MPGQIRTGPYSATVDAAGAPGDAESLSGGAGPGGRVPVDGIPSAASDGTPPAAEGPEPHAVQVSPVSMDDSSEDPEAIIHASALYVVSTAYLLLPALMFLATFVRWPITLGVGGMLVAGWVIDSRFEFRGSGLGRAGLRAVSAVVAVCVAAALWTSLFGAGFGPQTGDQIKNMALYKELVRQSWPVLYPQEEPEMAFLSYPFGYYLPAAAAAKLLGWNAGLLVMYVWASLGVALTWLWLRVFFRRFAAVAIAIFITFSGLDILGITLVSGDPTPAGGTHLEWWVGWTVLQYSSNATVMSWSTQHGVAQWLLPSLLYYRLVLRSTGRGVPLLVAVAAFWSHLTLIGAAVFIPLLIRSNQPRRLLRDRSTWLALPFLVLVGLFYASKAPGTIEHGWLWERVPFQELWPKALWFYLLEFGVLAMVIASTKVSWLRGERLLFASAVGLLLIVPFYAVGWSNDVSMRVSAIPLFVLLLMLCGATRDSVVARNRGALSVIGVYVAVASFTPLNEMGRQIAGIVPRQFSIDELSDGNWERGIRRGHENCFFTTAPQGFTVVEGDRVGIADVGNFLVTAAVIRQETLEICTSPGTSVSSRTKGRRVVHFERDGERLSEGWGRWTERKEPDAVPDIQEIFFEQYSGSEDSTFFRWVLRR